MVVRAVIFQIFSRIVASLFVLMISIPVVLTSGCANDAVEANKRQVQQNQALIEQSQQKIAMLQAQQNSPPPPATPGMPGACDKKVEATATRSAGDAYTSGDMTKALGYYRDAVTACPSSSKANVNLARTYETLDNRDSAIRYYRAAAASSDSDTASAGAAKSALSRLGVH